MGFALERSRNLLTLVSGQSIASARMWSRRHPSAAPARITRWHVTAKSLSEDAPGLLGHGFSRRSLLTSTASAAAPAPVAAVAQGRRSAESSGQSTVPRAVASFDLTVNRHPRYLTVYPRTTLLDALREHPGLTGAKKGCDHGQCGACAMLVGVRVLGV